MSTPDTVVGRQVESEVLDAALASGVNIVLEGPPGTGKTTLLRAVARRTGRAFILVEGNAELTPARLVGHFDPAQVIARGYRAEIFMDGPLVEAMRTGALLYLEEINRVPEETLNVLIAAMSERALVVPRLGLVKAEDGFSVIAAMNPFDAVGTGRISSALHDRMCRISMGYQPAPAEADIVAGQAPPVPRPWREAIVRIVRATRDHPEIHSGSSVRGAIDTVRLAVQVAAVRGVPATDREVTLTALTAALSGRIRCHPGNQRSAEEIIEDLFRAEFDRVEEENPSGE